jgi:ribosomal protein L21E/predicted SprT family Zn-dependent metalloprotease
MELRVAFEMAEGLVREHGLEGWQVQFDMAKRRAGVCRFGDRVIGLSAPITRVHSEADVRDTVLHEIAHALVGPAHGHDDVWKRTALAIGCSGKRCVSSESPAVPGAWVGICAAGHVRDRHRRPERVLSCSQCRPTFSVEHLFEWTYRGRPAPMHPNYQAELEAMRSGRRVHLAPVGSRVRVTLAGEFHGLVGRVVKVGRTSYHVRVRGGVLRVVFAGAERVR